MKLEMYKDVFKEEQVDGLILLDCDDAMLKDNLNISNNLHRKRLLLIAQGKHSAKEKLEHYRDQSSVRVPESPACAGATKQEIVVSRSEENTVNVLPNFFHPLNVLATYFLSK